MNIFWIEIGMRQDLMDGLIDSHQIEGQGLLEGGQEFIRNSLVLYYSGYELTEVPAPERLL